MGLFLIVTVYRIYQAGTLTPAQIAMIVVTVVLFVATVAAGGLLSVNKPTPLVVSFVHKLAPYLTVLSTGSTLYLLLA